MREFIHLHCASNFSLRYAAAFPEQLVAKAAELNLPGLALTDRDGLYGAVRFANAATAAGLKMMIGCELPLLAPRSKLVTPTIGGANRDLRPARVTILARATAGVVGLNRLVSARHQLEAISTDTVETVMNLLADTNMDGGLTILLGPDSDFGRALNERKYELAEKTLYQWQKTGAEIVVEVVSHRARDPQTAKSSVAGLRAHGLPLSTPAAARMWRFAVDKSVLAVLTNAVRHLEPKQARVVDVLDANRRLVALSGREVDRANGEGYLKSTAEMWQVATEIARTAGFGEDEQDQLWQQTLRLAERLEIDPELDLGIGAIHVPELDVIQGNTAVQLSNLWNRKIARRRSVHEIANEAKKADALLRKQCESVVANRFQRYAKLNELNSRLDDELDVIASLGFGSFFLTVAEVVKLARSLQIRVAARGSGAGSLVNHLLGISVLNPLEHGLIMERFLSPLRSSLPDIDIDVESERRLELYQATIERFGADRVVCVSMMETYRVRNAIRDVARAIGLPPTETDVLAKSFPHIRARDAKLALNELPELRRSGIGELARNGGLARILDLVEGLDGLPRNVALHPCGVLLSDSTLLDRTPIQESAAGFPMSHYDKDDVETLGFLKLDILGIRMQSAMAHSIAEIKRVQQQEIDLDQIPLDDTDTYDLISSTRTLGCFQIESPGQRELVGKFGPSTFNDIIIDISLFRPGPVKSDMVTPFLEARQGWKQPEFLHPDLKPVLAETGGVVVFHEQVIGVVSILTGCTLAEADEIRRALGDWDRQPELRGWFYSTTLKRGYDLEVVEKVWQVLKAFASFGFCKAHAGAFAVPTYQSAWLKTHFPAAFYAGVLTHDPGMYPQRLILDDARQFGVPILALDINHSRDRYQVQPSESGELGIRLPLAQVKGISTEEVQSLLLSQPFTDINDVWLRSEISRATLEKLVLAGALDRMYEIEIKHPRRKGVSRRDLLVHAAELERKHGRTVKTSELLFEDLTSAAPILTGLPEMTIAESLEAELEILGMDVSAHVVQMYEPLLAELAATRSKDLLKCRSKQEVLIGGIKVATQTPPVRSGKRVVFLTLDDATGPLDATFFEDAQGPYAHTLFHSWLLLVRGVVRRTGPRGISIRAMGCWDLQTAYQIYESKGIAAVWDYLDTNDSALEYDDEGTAAAAESRSLRPVMAGRRAGGMGGGNRVLVHPSGFRMSPWADIVPAGGAMPNKLWHTSPGSPG